MYHASERKGWISFVAGERRRHAHMVSKQHRPESVSNYSQGLLIRNSWGMSPVVGPAVAFVHGVLRARSTFASMRKDCVSSSHPFLSTAPFDLRSPLRFMHGAGSDIEREFD